jgi:hypothetical protein
MKKLTLITWVLFGISAANAEETQTNNENSSDEVQVSEGETCKDDGILDSIESALNDSDLSLKFSYKSLPFGGVGKRPKVAHTVFPTEPGEAGPIMVQVPLTPELIASHMDKALKKAQNCKTKWSTDIAKGDLTIDEETKAGAAAFVFEALKSGMPREQIELSLFSYFRGEIKWNELMAKAKTVESKRSAVGQGIPLPGVNKKLPQKKLPFGEAR